MLLIVSFYYSISRKSLSCTSRSSFSACREGRSCTPCSFLQPCREDMGCTPHTCFSASREGRDCTPRTVVSVSRENSRCTPCSCFLPCTPCRYLAACRQDRRCTPRRSFSTFHEDTGCTARTGVYPSRASTVSLASRPVCDGLADIPRPATCDYRIVSPSHHGGVVSLDKVRQSTTRERSPRSGPLSGATSSRLVFRLVPDCPKTADAQRVPFDLSY